MGLTIWLLYFTQTWVINVIVDSKKGLQTILGQGYIIWGIAIWSVLGWAIVNLLFKIRRSSGSIRIQLLYLMLGFALFGITSTIADIIVPLIWHDTSLFPYSTTGTLFFTFAVAYAIVRHRFMDICFALQKFFIFIIQVILTAGLMDVGAIIYWALSNNTPRPSVFILIFGLSFLINLMISRIQTWSQFLARQLFFQSVYDYQKTLKDLSVSLSSYLEMPKLVDIIINVMMKTMRLSRVAVLVRDFDVNHYKIQKTIGFDENNGISLVKDNFLTTYLEVHAQIIVLDELKSIIEEAKDPYEKDRLQQLYEHMEHIEAGLIVPVVNHQRVISLIVLGNKISGDPYTVQDIDLLHTIASQASIAIENARLYREVRDLNQNLTQRVDEATGELQKKNEDLQGAYQRLQTLDKLKDDFVSIVSHELRTPMTAIRSYIWMALYRPDSPLSEKLKKYLERSYISTDRLINLVNDMLNVSRIESGRIQIDPKAFDIQTLVDDVIAEVGPKAAEKQIHLYSLKNHIPLVFADCEKVHQVLLNLLGNALKFTPVGGSITVSYFSDGQTVDISVKDSGVGITKEDLARLFQKFGRLDNSYVAAATAGGTGLGLYICKSLVELMHGKIWAASEGLNKGTTFTFTLPAATPSVLAQAGKYTKIAIGGAKSLEPVTI